MTERQFHVGQEFEVAGQWVRVTQGRKQDDDLVIELYSPIGGRGWVKVGFDLLGLLYAFLYENEEFLYPQPRYKGGGKVNEHCKRAYREGWEAAAKYVQLERETKAEQLGLAEIGHNLSSIES